MLTPKLQRLTTTWPPLSEIVYVPHSEREYQSAVDMLDNLIDEVGEDETHPLASLMEVLGALIETYEDARVPEITEL